MNSPGGTCSASRCLTEQRGERQCCGKEHVENAGPSAATVPPTARGAVQPHGGKRGRGPGKDDPDCAARARRTCRATTISPNAMTDSTSSGTMTRRSVMSHAHADVALDSDRGQQLGHGHPQEAQHGLRIEAGMTTARSPAATASRPPDIDVGRKPRTPGPASPRTTRA